jgi:pimeloyl-ACP methyl ester carboxylesterase
VTVVSVERVGGLAVYPRAARVAGGADRHPPTVVFVHGAMDRGAAFAGVCRHLADHPTVRYDRRGYGRSGRAGLAPTIRAQADDLLTVVSATVDGPCILVGHSLGGVIALAAAARCPAPVAAVVAYEPPTPWASWWPTPGPAPGLAPAESAERFMRRIVGDDRWEALPAGTRARRRAEGDALVADLRSLRGRAPLDPAAPARPVVLGRGGACDRRHVRAVEELAAALPDVEVVVIHGAGHDAHHRQAAAFAGLVRRAADRPAPLA